MKSVALTPDFPEGRNVDGCRCFQPCPFSAWNHISRFPLRPCNPRPQEVKKRYSVVLQRIRH